MNTVLQISLLILVIPLLGGLLGLIKGKLGPILQTGSLGISLALSLWLLFTTHEDVIGQIVWFEVSGLRFSAGVLLNRVALFMTFVVNLIAFVVSIFSLEYMASDSGRNRYHFALGLFTTAMLGIVYADNLLLLFVFWELVGFTSYLLINHYFQKDSASLASMKAFVINRIGDAGFVIGMAILWSFTGTLDLSALAENPLENGWGIAASLCLFLGVIGKSAQFPLQVWLPDAMEGPTPASALIHAATMVAAGVYLLFRTISFMGNEALEVIALIGALTAFMGAVAAVSQYDIKRVLAFSTISQLGYMVLAMGVQQPDLGIFHLFTHAFFKAGLFLGTGTIIYALHEYTDSTDEHFDVQDMRNMGGLRKVVPQTFVLYLIFTAALVGIPLTSGFLSKDAILAGSYVWAEGEMSWKIIVPALAFITVVLTAYYMTRQILMVFFGEPRSPGINQVNVSEPSLLMRLPMYILAVGSLWILWSLNPLSMDFMGITTWIMPEIKMPGAEYHAVFSSVAVLLVLCGGAMACWKFGKAESFRDTSEMSFMDKLSASNWWLDRIYSKLIVHPLLQLGGLMRWIDRRVIDGLVNGLGICYVVFSHIVAWFDRNIVDGMVHVVAGTARVTGNVSAAATRAGAQWYIWLAIGGGLIIMWFLI